MKKTLILLTVSVLLLACQPVDAAQNDPHGMSFGAWLDYLEVSMADSRVVLPRGRIATIYRDNIKIGTFMHSFEVGWPGTVFHLVWEGSVAPITPSMPSNVRQHVLPSMCGKVRRYYDDISLSYHCDEKGWHEVTLAVHDESLRVELESFEDAFVRDMPFDLTRDEVILETLVPFGSGIEMTVGHSDTILRIIHNGRPYPDGSVVGYDWEYWNNEIHFQSYSFYHTNMPTCNPYGAIGTIDDSFLNDNRRRIGELQEFDRVHFFAHCNEIDPKLGNISIWVDPDNFDSRWGEHYSQGVSMTLYPTWLDSIGR